MKAALYARVSTTEQAEEGFSIQAQTKLLQEYCSKNTVDVYDIYIDEGISGQKENRPQFQRMLKDAEKKLFNIILVHKYDRFARKVELSQRIKNQLSKSSVNVISITEPIEDSPMGFFVSGLHELMAEYYVRNLAQEVKKGMRERVSRGLHNGAVPYGYRTENGMMYIQEEQAAVVRKIFEMYNNGCGSSVISKWLDENKISSAIPGAKWNHYAVLYILNNVKYAGYIRHAEEIYQGQHEPIIDKETFELAAQCRKNRFVAREPKGKNEVKYMLLGLLRCGVCGYKFSIHEYSQHNKFKPRGSYGYYVCHRSKVHENHKKCTHSHAYRSDILEDLVISKYNKWIKGLETFTTKLGSDTMIYETQINNLQREIARAETMCLKELMTIERYSDIKTENDKLIREISLKIDNSVVVKRVDAGQEIEAIMNETNPAKRRLIIQRYIKGIELYPGTIVKFIER